MSSFWERVKAVRDAAQPPATPPTRPASPSASSSGVPSETPPAFHALLPTKKPIPGVYIGRSTYPGDHRRFFVPVSEMLYHMFIVGQTGNGKTTVTTHMILSLLRLLKQDPDHGPGFAFVDPHGDAVSNILANVPRELADRVHVIHFRDTDWPRAFNFLDVPPEQAADAVGMFVSMIREQFAGQTGNRSDHYLRTGLLTLTAAGSAGHPQTIIAFDKLFFDEDFREHEVLPFINDPKLESFWAEEGDFHRQERQMGQILAPIIQKLGAFDTYAPIRNVVGQRTSTIKFREWMDAGQIVIIDLSGLNSDIGSIIGSMLISRFHFAALSRRDIPKTERRPFILLADEIAGFATPTMADILSEDRKFGLGLVLATQYLDRIPSDVLNGLNANAHTWYVLGLSNTDAKRLSSWFGAGVSVQELSNTPRYHAYIRMTEPTGQYTVVTATFDPEPPGDAAWARELVAQSDLRDGRPRADVERDIADFYHVARPDSRITGSAAPVDEPPPPKRPKTKWDAATSTPSSAAAAVRDALMQGPFQGAQLPTLQQAGSTSEASSRTLPEAMPVVDPLLQEQPGSLQWADDEEDDAAPPPEKGASVTPPSEESAPHDASSDATPPAAPGPRYKLGATLKKPSPP